MSIRTTVTLDDDVIERIKQVSRARGSSFRDTLNDLLHSALISKEFEPTRNPLRVKATRMGLHEGLSYDIIETLIEYSEGPLHR